MGASNAKPSKCLLNKDGTSDVLEQTSGSAEDQASPQNTFCTEPLDDIYTGVLTADIRSDYLYSGLTQHYQAGNAITASFNLVPTATSVPTHLYKHRAVIRLAPLKRYQAGVEVEYDLHVETSMTMAYTKYFEKEMTSTNSMITYEFIGTDYTSVTEPLTSVTEVSTSCTKSIVEDNSSRAEDTASGMKGNEDKYCDMLEKIAQYTSSGGRLMCIAVTGCPDQALASRLSLFDPKSRFNIYSVVDIFLEVPRAPIPAMFTYQAVTACIPYRVTGLWNRDVSVIFDYMAFFIAQINNGWKLVGIIQYYAGKNRLNSLWFFEKENTRINDRSPVYKGTILVHKHICESTTRGQEVIKSDVTPILQEMRSKGWEIACSLETPDVKRLDKITTQISILLFFQRRISNRH